MTFSVSSSQSFLIRFPIHCIQKNTLNIVIQTSVFLFCSHFKPIKKISPKPECRLLSIKCYRIHNPFHYILYHKYITNISHLYNKTKIYYELNIKHSENTKEFTSSPAMILLPDNRAGHPKLGRHANKISANATTEAIHKKS